MLKRARGYIVTHKTLVFILCVFVYQALSFYFVIAGAGLTDPDDFGGFGSYNKPDFHWHLSDPFHAGRFAMQFMDSLLFPHIQYRMGSFAGIMLFTLLGNLVSLIALMLVVREVADIYAALCSGIIFFSCAQICHHEQASGFYSWSWSYQVKMFYFMMSLFFLIRYFKDDRKRLRWPVFSALFYVLACMTYEAFVPLILVLLMAALYGLYLGKDLNLKAFMRIAPFYAMGSLFYFVMYFIGRSLHKPNGESSVMKVVNDFAADAPVFSVADYIRENFIVSFALFPGAQCAPLTEVTPLSQLLKYDFESVFAALITAAAVIMCLVSAKKLPLRRLLVYSAILAVGTVLASTVWVFSDQGYNLMAYQTVHFSRSSYFSYFFLCGLITAALLLIFQSIKYSFPRFVLFALLFLGFSYTIVCTLENNRVWARAAYVDIHSRVMAYARFFQTDYYQSLPEGTKIYLDGEYETIYARGWSGLYCDRAREFFWKEGELDFSEPTYFLHYSKDNQSVFFGLVDSKFKTDDIYVTSMEDLRDYGFNVSRIGEPESTLTLNYEQEKEHCREDVVYSLHTMPWFIDEGHYADIQASGMDWYSFGLIQGELMNSLRENPGSSRYHGWED